jgi:hypothetical protein
MPASQLALVLRLLQSDEDLAQRAPNPEAWPEMATGKFPEARAATRPSAKGEAPQKSEATTGDVERLAQSMRRTTIA